MFDHAKCDLAWHDMACRDFKDLSRAAVSDKVLHDKKLNVAINLKQFGYQRALHQWFLGFLIKKVSCGVIKSEILSNMQLSQEIHKSKIRKSQKD